MKYHKKHIRKIIKYLVYSYFLSGFVCGYFDSNVQKRISIPSKGCELFEMQSVKLVISSHVCLFRRSTSIKLEYNSSLYSLQYQTVKIVIGILRKFFVSKWSYECQINSADGNVSIVNTKTPFHLIAVFHFSLHIDNVHINRYDAIVMRMYTQMSNGSDAFQAIIWVALAFVDDEFFVIVWMCTCVCMFELIYSHRCIAEVDWRCN